ncbi:MAG TPA: hypothetical protein VHR84_12070 [Terriglobales bacterium]|nr:hypothetical protein [Terriglobales bacterium]
MKKTIFVTAICVGLVAMMSARAAEKAENPSLAILSDNKAGASEKVSAIEAYVRSVEKNISSSQRREQMLSPGELKNVTNENWTKIHTYSDGADLKRMKLYPPAGSQRTEEFYYHDGKPVFVFLEANGAGKENHDRNATGDKYYFTDGELIAATAADGKSIDVKSAEAKKMSEKLQKESEAFRATAK